MTSPTRESLVHKELTSNELTRFSPVLKRYTWEKKKASLYMLQKSTSDFRVFSVVNVYKVMQEAIYMEGEKKRGKGDARSPHISSNNPDIRVL